MKVDEFGLVKIYDYNLQYKRVFNHMPFVTANPYFSLEL